MEHSLAGILWRLAGIMALVVANGFFVAAEFSIVTVRKTRIDQLKNFGHVGEVTVVAPGINGKMSEFNAALGLHEAS